MQLSPLIYYVLSQIAMVALQVSNSLRNIHTSSEAEAFPATGMCLGGHLVRNYPYFLRDG